jgi:hypothetical protein
MKNHLKYKDMRNVLLAILLLTLTFGVRSQELLNNQNVYGYNEVYEVVNDDEDNSYIVHYVGSNSIDIQHKFKCDECKESYVIAKYNNKNEYINSFIIPRIHEREFSFAIHKTKIINNKLILIGQTNGHIKINDKILNVIIPIVDSIKHGYVMEFDLDLNYISCNIVKTGFPQDIIYNNNEYCVVGWFRDSTVTFLGDTLKQKYFSKSWLYSQQAFLFIVDEKFEKVERNLYLSGDGLTSIDQVEVNSNGDFILFGESSDGILFVGDQPIFLNHFIFEEYPYLLSIDRNFKVNYIKNFRKAGSYKKFVLDEADNVYAYLYFSDEVIINDTSYNKKEDSYFATLIKFNPEGDINWLKSIYPENENFGGLSVKNLIISEDALNIVAHYHHSIYMDDGLKIEAKNNTKFFNAVIMELDKENGNFIKNNYPDPLTPLNIEGCYLRKNGDFLTVVSIVRHNGGFQTHVMNPILYEALYDFATYVMLDFRVKSTNTEEQISEQDIHVFPNLLHFGQSFLIDIENEKVEKVRILSINGVEQNVQIENNTLNCKSCISGIYLVSFIVNGKHFTKKILFN